MDIEVRHLRMLCAIADAGSLSQAASVLGLTQPAISVSLRRLESQLGTKLFARSSSGVEPNDAGLRLVTRARVALAEIDQLTSGVVSTTSPSPLSAGVSLMTPAPSMMAAFRTRFGARIRFTLDGSTASIAHDLKHHKHDFAVVMVSEDWQNELPSEVVSRVLQPAIPVFVAMQASHPLAAGHSVPLSDLAQEAWIVPPGSDDGSLAELRNACSQSGFMPDIRYVAPSGTGRSIIEQNDAVQLVEPTTVNSDRLVTRPLVGDPLKLRLTLAWHRDRLGPGLPDEIHRIAFENYALQAKANPVFRAWWKRNRGELVWVRQLDQVFGE